MKDILQQILEKKNQDILVQFDRLSEEKQEELIYNLNEGMFKKFVSDFKFVSRVTAIFATCMSVVVALGDGIDDDLWRFLKKFFGQDVASNLKKNVSEPVESLLQPYMDSVKVQMDSLKKWMNEIQTKRLNNNGSFRTTDDRDNYFQLKDEVDELYNKLDSIRTVKQDLGAAVTATMLVAICTALMLIIWKMIKFLLPESLSAKSKIVEEKLALEVKKSEKSLKEIKKKK